MFVATATTVLKQQSYKNQEVEKYWWPPVLSLSLIADSPTVSF